MTIARGAILATYPQPPGAEAGGLPLRKLAAGMFRARWWLLATTSIGLLVGAFLAVTTPNSYLSQGKFLFTSGSENIQIDLDRISETKAEVLAAQAIYVLKADDLLRRVAERVTPARILTPYQPEGNSTASGSVLHEVQRTLAGSGGGEGTVEDAMRLLTKNLVIDQPRFTNVLVVSYLANDRRLAQEVLAAYMEEAKKFHQEMYDDPKKYDQARKQVDDAQIALTAAVKARQDFLENVALVTNTFDYELQHAQQSEGEAADDLEKNATAIVSIKQQIAAQKAYCESLPANIVVKRRVDVTQRAIDVLVAEIGRLTVQRTTLKIDSAQPNPEGLAQIDKKIEQLQKDLQDVQSQQKNATEISVEERNPDQVKAYEELAKLNTEQVGREASAGQLRASRDAAAARLRKLRELEPRYAALRDAASRAEAEHKAARDVFAAADRRRQMNIGDFSTLKTFGFASLPLEKEGPNRSRLVLGGLILGLFFGLGIIVLRSLPDSTVRTPTDLEGIDGIPVIGMMPRLDGRNLRRHEAARERGF